MTQFVGYTRVSTREQGDSRLGLEAQSAAIAAFRRQSDLLIQPVFVEIQSGKKCQAEGAGGSNRSMPHDGFDFACVST